MNIWDVLSRLDTVVSLFSAFFGGALVWVWRKMRDKRRRIQRLREVTQAAKVDEVAICIRVGGSSDPVPDVLKYLRAHHQNIKQLIVYRVSAGDAERRDGRLDDEATAAKIVEDINEGIRAYGQGEITRVHYFPAGMLAYAPALFAVMSNWGKIVVYHKQADTYTPLYEVDKDRRHSERREFASLKSWEVIPTQVAPEASLAAPGISAEKAKQPLLKLLTLR
jgi:hypothetical protein